VPQAAPTLTMTAKPPVTVVGASLAALLLVVGSAATSTLGTSARPPGPLCVTTGPVAGLSPTQATNARIVAATAAARGGPAAALLALMVGLAESGMRVLANPNDPSGAAHPHDGVGYDHDSLGIFQQRPSWGSAAQRMDPSASTDLFVDALMALPNWQSHPPAVAAQLVQRSAFDVTSSAANGGSAVVGANYPAQQPLAIKVLGIISGDAALLDCGASAGSVDSGIPGAHGLPTAYAIPAATSPQARIAVAFALAQLGKPYQWGASGPAVFDCSGLMQAAWARAGVTISRTTYTELHDGTPTDLAHLLPGDLVLTPGSDGSLALPGHVGMFIGNGLVVEAPKTGDVVKVVNVGGFTSGGVSTLRHIG